MRARRGGEGVWVYWRCPDRVRGRRPLAAIARAGLGAEGVAPVGAVDGDLRRVGRVAFGRRKGGRAARHGPRLAQSPLRPAPPCLGDAVRRFVVENILQDYALDVGHSLPGGRGGRHGAVHPGRGFWRVKGVDRGGRRGTARRGAPPATVHCPTAPALSPPAWRRTNWRGRGRRGAQPPTWNQRARHCWAVRPSNARLTADQRDPCAATRAARAPSSSGDQPSRRMAGSRWRRQRPMHCWSVRPVSARAMSAQAAPLCRTSSLRRASSTGVHLSLRMVGLSLWRQRWAHCWPVRPGMHLATEDQLWVFWGWGSEREEVSLNKRERERESGEKRKNEEKKNSLSLCLTGSRARPGACTGPRPRSAPRRPS